MGTNKTRDALDEDEEVILGYLQRQNRPYSAIDISSNLQKELGLSKAAVSKILSSLEVKGLIASKTYGKAVIYVAKQDDQGIEEGESAKQLELNLTDLKEQRQALQGRLDKLRNEISLITNTLTDEDLEYQVLLKSKHLSTMKEELAMFDNGSFEPVDVQVLEERRRMLNHLEIQSKHREKAFRQMWALVKDNVPDPNHKWEELGLD